MFFKNPEHKTRFVKSMQHIEKVYGADSKLDPEYAAAFYILTADLATWERVQPSVSRHGIDFPGILADVDFSQGHAVLVQLAGNLFNEQTEVSPVECVILDTANFQVALQAQLIRYHAPRLKEL